MNQVEQLHFGGGTPTYLSDAQMDDLMAHLRRCFHFAPDDVGEYSIEIDPRTCRRRRACISCARRVSTASAWACRTSIRTCRRRSTASSPKRRRGRHRGGARAGFRSVSIDLIYGLPKQTLRSRCAHTLDKVIAARPGPHRASTTMRTCRSCSSRSAASTRPTAGADTKLACCALCIERLTARAMSTSAWTISPSRTTTLAVAQRQGRLHRNFQGYSTHAGLRSGGAAACRRSARSAPRTARTSRRWRRITTRSTADELPVARGMRCRWTTCCAAA